jgi:putative ABC transport system permease protein
MNTSRLLRSSLRAMARFRLRSAFLTLGSLVGVAALTFVITIGAAAQRKILATVRQLFGPSSIVVSSGGGFFMGGPRGEAARLTLDDAAALAEALPEVETWDPMQIVPEAQVRRGEAARSVRLVGASERYGHAWGRGISSGEPFDAAAVARSDRVALLGVTVARALFPDQDPVGGEVQVGSVPFRVIGVLERLGTDIHGMDRDDEIVVPISAAMRRVMNVDTIRAVKLLVRDPRQVDAVAQDVEHLLRERHRLETGQPSDFTLMSSSTVHRNVTRVERVLFLYLPLVAVLSLLAGGAVAASLMLAAVNERVPEIGLRRALGARPRDIRLQFLVEAAVTAVGGGLGGVVLGSAAAMGAAWRFGLPNGISLAAIALGLALALATGLLAGVLPARRAALLEPATALR